MIIRKQVMIKTCLWMICALMLSGCSTERQNYDKPTAIAASESGSQIPAADVPPKVSGIIPDPASGYADEDLLNMAKAYCLEHNGSVPQYAEIEEMPDSYGRVSVWLYDADDGDENGAHRVTSSCYYYVNRHTAQGTDGDFIPVDLTDILTDREPENERCYEFVTDIPAASVEQFAKQVKQQLLRKDWSALAENLSYPVTIDGEVFHGREEFLAADFEERLNPYFFVELEEENCRQMFSDSDGIILGTERVWIAEVSGDDLSSQGLRVTKISGLTESFGLPGGVRLKILPDTLTPPSVKLLLENETDLNLIFGDDYKLQKYNFEDETWTDLEPITDDAAFHDIGYTPKRGNPVEWSVDWSPLYGNLEKGRYAIVKTVRDEDAPADSGVYECALDFFN